MNDVATGADRAKVQTRTFVGHRAELDDAISALSIESQAALRQFSLERLMGYSMDYADAIELRARVLDGQSWQDAATALAQTCIDRLSAAPEEFSAPTRVAYLRRASALTRMSQVMMLSDTPERRQIYRRAADLYAQAADIAGDRERLAVGTDQGTLAGWLVPAGTHAVASAVVLGGVEGWAMDFDSTGVALAERGVDAFMLDGPGQGESRMNNGAYLTAGWLDTYRRVVDELERRAPGRPIGVIGNSMGAVSRWLSPPPTLASPLAATTAASPPQDSSPQCRHLLHQDDGVLREQRRAGDLRRLGDRQPCGRRAQRGLPAPDRPRRQGPSRLRRACRHARPPRPHRRPGDGRLLRRRPLRLQPPPGPRCADRRLDLLPAGPGRDERGLVSPSVPPHPATSPTHPFAQVVAPRAVDSPGLIDCFTRLGTERQAARNAPVGTASHAWHIRQRSG